MHNSKQKNRSSKQSPSIPRRQNQNKGIENFTKSIKQFSNNRSKTGKFIEAIVADNSIIYLDEDKNYAIVKRVYLEQLQNQITEGKILLSKMTQIEGLNTLIKLEIERKIAQNNKMKETVNQLVYLNDQFRKKMQMFKNQTDLENKELIERLEAYRNNELRKLQLITSKNTFVTQYSQTSISEIPKPMFLHFQSCESVKAYPTNECFKECFSRQEKVLQSIDKKIQSTQKQKNNFLTLVKELFENKVELEYYKMKYQQIFNQKQILRQKIDEYERKNAEIRLSEWKKQMNKFVDRIQKEWNNSYDEQADFVENQYQEKPQLQQQLLCQKDKNQLLLLKRILQNPMIPQPLEHYKCIQSMPKLDFQTFAKTYREKYPFLDAEPLEKTPIKPDADVMKDQNQKNKQSSRQNYH